MKLFGCICFIAGTAIGAGMLALPIALAKFGLIIGSIIMLLTWGICYISALLSLELNLRAGKGIPLGGLGMHFSGIKSYFAGSFSLLLLCYALLCAYLYGAASTLSCINGFPLSLHQTACIYAVLLGLLMLCPIQKIDLLNRFFFLGKILVTALIVVTVIFEVNPSYLPLKIQADIHLSDIHMVLPIVFTSFGFQVIAHSLTNYTNGNSVMLKKAFFWGSLIPAFVYIGWTIIVCGLIYNNMPDLFQKMLSSNIEVGQVLQALCHVSKYPIIKHLTWTIGFFAVLTATIGVSLGLIDALKTKHPFLNKQIIAVIIAITPSLAVALITPNAFIKALSFAGMILSFIALLLPMYLLFCANRKKQNPQYWYPVLKNPILLIMITIYGFIVIYSEMHNIFFK